VARPPTASLSQARRPGRAAPLRPGLGLPLLVPSSCPARDPASLHGNIHPQSSHARAALLCALCPALPAEARSLTRNHFSAMEERGATDRVRTGTMPTPDKDPVNSKGSSIATRFPCASVCSPSFGGRPPHPRRHPLRHGPPGRRARVHSRRDGAIASQGCWVCWG
jgi:hypothetical protein